MIPGLQRRLPTATLATAVVLLSAVAYIPAYNAGFIWDDDQYVHENPTLPRTEGLQEIWFRFGATPQYYPVVFSSFWIEYRLWGFHPMGYHGVNVAFHGLAAALAGILLSRLGVRGAWLAAALFALHPVHVESVAWITERKNVLSAAFYLASLTLLARFSGLDGAPTPRRRRLLYAASLGLFLCALWSKTVTASLPAAFLLLVWWRTGRVSRSHVGIVAPFFAVGAVLASITVWMERAHVGAHGDTWNLSLAERILVAGRASWFYLGKILWPANLSFNYERWQVDSTSPWQWAAPVSTTAALLILYAARERTGRGPLTAALFYVGTLLPALGFFDVFPFRYSFVADHFQYLASLGPLTLAAAGITGLFRREGARRLAAAGTAALLIGLGTLTWHQTRVYENLDVLWRDTLRKNPASWLAHNNLGTLLMERGGFESAEDHYRRAVAAAPTYHESRNNLAVALARQGKTDEALATALEAVRLSPRHTGARNTLGLLLSRVGRLREAEEQFREILRIDPAYSKGHAGLGTVLVRAGRIQEGVEHLREAVRLEPDSAEARINLASALQASGQSAEARREALEAERLAPDDARIRSRVETLR